MGRTSNQDLLKALKMVARGMDEHKAWVTCNQPTTWGNAQRVFKEARKQREAAPATTNVSISPSQHPLLLNHTGAVWVEVRVKVSVWA